MSELRIERRYPIEPAALFTYITRTENLLKWWGPEGMTASEVNLDLARVGPWSLVLTGPRGSLAMRGEVRRVVPPSLLELTMNTPGPDGDDGIVRFEIAADGQAGSLLTLIQSGITDQMVEMGKRGWGSTLDRLGLVIASAQV